MLYRPAGPALAVWSRAFAWTCSLENHTKRGKKRLQSLFCTYTYLTLHRAVELLACCLPWRSDQNKTWETIKLPIACCWSFAWSIQTGKEGYRGSEFSKLPKRCTTVVRGNNIDLFALSENAGLQLCSVKEFPAGRMKSCVLNASLPVGKVRHSQWEGCCWSTSLLCWAEIFCAGQKVKMYWQYVSIERIATDWR